MVPRTPGSDDHGERQRRRDFVDYVPLTVDNVAATITSDGDVTVLEGQTATASGTWSDPGLDNVTLSASVGSVTRHADGTWTWSYATTDGPEDTRK
ncbi:MAG: hypothetical protein U0935_07070 [Pirellulales bacterium]